MEWESYGMFVAGMFAFACLFVCTIGNGIADAIGRRG